MTERVRRSEAAPRPLRTRALLGLLGLALVAEGLVFGEALYNRSTAGPTTLEMTEREFPRAEPLGKSPFLRLRWEQPEDPAWPGQEALASLGFDLSAVSDGSPSSRLRREKVLPRSAYVALEYEGDAWEAWLARSQIELDALAGRVERGEMTREEFEASRQALERERRTRSRLFAVDVGADRTALRARYPDPRRYLILAGEVRLAPGEGGETGARVNVLTPEELRAPDGDFAALEGRTGHPDPYWSAAAQPSYRVKLAVGRLGPWIQSVEAQRR